MKKIIAWLCVFAISPMAFAATGQSSSGSSSSTSISSSWSSDQATNDLFSSLLDSSADSGSSNSSVITTSVAPTGNQDLTISATDDPSDSKIVMLVWNLQVSGTGNISTANIKIKYDPSLFSIKSSDVTIWDGMALSTVKNPVSISNWTISFTVSNSNPFTSTKSQVLFVASFIKKQLDLTTYSFNASSSSILDSKGSSVKLGSVVWIYKSSSPSSVDSSSTNSSGNTSFDLSSVSWSNNDVSSSGTDSSSQDIPTLSGSDINSDWTVSASDSWNSDSINSESTGTLKASQVKTGAFENILVIIAFSILGIALFRRKKEKNV